MARILSPLALCCLAFSGCSHGNFVSVSFPVTSIPIAGKLLSGTLPVAGAHVYLLAVATSGYGKPSVSLLDQGSTGFADSTGTYVVTASDGTFTVPGYYTCSAQTDVYLYTSGGDSGLGQNSAATGLAAVGPCPQLGAAVPPLVVDEVTTVAMAFALAGYATNPLHISSSGSPMALTGVANAFVNASHLASVNTGTAPAMLPSGAATVPQATINTLANILSACIHSTGAGSSACQTLLGNAGSAPPYNDTAAATLALAHSPASGGLRLFPLHSPSAPFAPALTVVPNDFSLGLVFTGGGMLQTDGMAVDASGNVWSTNDSYFVTEISSAGVFLSGPSGYLTGTYAAGPIALDLNGNVWIGNGAHTFNGPGSIVELSSSGATLSGANGYGYGVLRTPQGLAIDANDNIWVADTMSNSILEFSNSGQLLSGSKGFTGGGISSPTSVSIDALGDAWSTNYSAPSINELSNTGTPLTPSTGITGPTFYGGASLAIDHQNSVWEVTAGTEHQASKVSSSGVILSGTGYTGGGLGAPTTASHTSGGGTTIAIDGDGNAWIPLYGLPEVVELSNSGVALSGPDGYGGGVADSPQDIVIDGSGDVWVANDTYQGGMRGVPGVYTWRITEMIGVAAPVVTPLSAGVQSNTLGSRP